MGHKGGSEVGNYSIPFYKGNLFHRISTTQNLMCSKTFLYEAMPITKSVMFGSNPVHNPHLPPIWDGCKQ